MKRRPKRLPWTDAQRLANIRRQVAEEERIEGKRREDPVFKDRRMLLRMLDAAERRYAERWLGE